MNNGAATNFGLHNNRATSVAHGRRQKIYYGFWIYSPLVIILAFRLASGQTADISYLALAVYALGGRTHVLRALTMSWFFSMISPGLAPDPSHDTIGRYVVLAACAVSVLFHGGFFKGARRSGGVLLGTIIVGIFLVCHSYFVSPMKDVSVLKVVSWVVAMTTILAAWAGLSAGARAKVAQEIYVVLVMILFFSIPLFFSSLGYLRNGTGFQGVLNHPQAFGPSMALLGTWSAARFLGVQRPAWAAVGLFGICLVFVLASEARTAGFAMILGLAIAASIARVLSGVRIRQLLPGLGSPRLWAVFFSVVIAGIVFAPVIANKFQIYVTKSSRVEAAGLWEAYDKSRGRLIDNMVQNIEQRPILGIGFGIASEPALMEIRRDPVFNLPIGASIEKGVMPLAIIEETGIIGSIILGGWFFAMLRRSGRGGIAPLSIALTVLLSNLGESTFFSVGGLGLIMLIIIGWSATSAPPSARAL